ncbi:MAG TPA: hypothetical protein PKH77_24410 [Anaerolineae bacterium]|nr:hypothetical protein [Anaerolineae bacterium]
MEVRVRSYSGRSMYGRECVGAVIGRHDSQAYLAALTMLYADDEEREELSNLWRDVCSDSMGMGTVIYFPSVDWPEDAVVSEDNDE